MSDDAPTGVEEPNQDAPDAVPAEKAGTDKRDQAFAEIRRELDAQKKLVKRLEAEKADREQREAEKRGEWEQLAKQAQSERDALAEQMKRQQARNLVVQEASKAGLKNPEDAAAFLADRINEIEDAAQAAKAIKELVKERDYLLAPKVPEPAGLQKVLENGKPVDGDRAAQDAPLMTRDEVVRTTPEQVADMSDAEYQRYLKSAAVLGATN